MYRIKYTLLILLLSGIYTNVFSQTEVSFKEKTANKYFADLNYLKAIIAYEDIIKEDSSNKRVLPNLGESYRKVSDMKNAERIYAQIVKGDSVSAENTLYYAQALAANKKYDESVIYYGKYSALKANDTRGAEFVKAYGNITDFFRDSARKQVAFANFNSGQSDFSPAYYKNGLVFCSNRTVGVKVKRVFEWNESAFLDLYYVADTADIKPARKMDSSEAAIKKRKMITNDDDTYQTSNDSRTVGFTAHNYIDTSGTFASSEIKVERFSRKISSKYHEGPLSFFSSQDSVIFTRNNYNKGKYREAEDGINKLKLYSAVYKDGKWKKVKPLPFNNDNYSVGHPAIAPGDTILYFASDMPGGLGGVDIYKTYYRNGTWSTPENLGAPINTVGNEVFPFVDAQGILYFSSDGHPGLGGLDIFSTSLLNIKIENLGYPVNSNFDDFGIALDKTTATGFFSSNRRRGLADDDIYTVRLEKPLPFIVQIVDSVTNELIALSTAVILDSITKQRQPTDSSKTGRYNASLWDRTTYHIAAAATGYDAKNVTVIADIKNPVITIKLVKLIAGCIVAGTITDKDTKLPVPGARITIYDRLSKDTVYDVTVGEDGKYKYVSIQSDRIYDMSVGKTGYFNKPPIQLNTKGAKCLSAIEREYDFLRDFELEQIIVGKAIKIDNIYFDLNKYNIRKDAAVELDKIVKLMEENPDIIIELSSHTDCRSSYQYNMTLSDNRAKSSAAYIVSKGISQERITGKGYGETRLVNDCACEGKVISRVCTEDEHQANRRTEFQVTGFLSDKGTQMLNEGRGETPKSVPQPPPGE